MQEFLERLFPEAADPRSRELLDIRLRADEFRRTAFDATNEQLAACQRIVNTAELLKYIVNYGGLEAFLDDWIPRTQAKLDEVFKSID